MRLGACSWLAVAALALGCNSFSLAGSRSATVSGSSGTGPGTGTGAAASTGSPNACARGTSSGGQGSSTGAPTPGYQGFDSGPRFEPPISPGCFSSTPFFIDGIGCAQCRSDADCPRDRWCDISLPGAGQGQCQLCFPQADGGSLGCSPGQICAYDDGEYACIDDCRVACQSCDAGSFCDFDSGLCNGYGFCGSAAQCGPGMSCANPGTVYSRCVDCIPNDAGCAPGELCDVSTLHCHANCMDSGVACPFESLCDPPSGECLPGCRSEDDCGGATPFCPSDVKSPVCSECSTAADCPAGELGCGRDPSCFEGCAKTCGLCGSDDDCPSPLRCIGNPPTCDCSSVGDCAGFPATPVCVGIGDGGSSFGLCGCQSSDSCGAGFVCDQRLGERNTGSRFFLSIGGGMCVARCAGQAASYCSTLYAAPSVCNPATGFCVPCLDDADCKTNASEPLQTPSCIPYPGGVDIDFNLSLATGGGQCGCADTASCDDGRTCQDAGVPGTCVVACTDVGGLDSCSPQYCNTYTGLCQDCLDDYDCVVNGENGPRSLHCNPQGYCVDCVDASQCDGGACCAGACWGSAACP